MLYQAVPAIADGLKAIDARAHELQALFDCIVESQWAQSLQLQLLIFGSLMFWLKVPSVSIYLYLTAQLLIAQLLTAQLLTAQLPIIYPLAPLFVAGLSQYISAQATAAVSPSASPLFPPTTLLPLLQLQL